MRNYRILATRKNLKKHFIEWERLNLIIRHSERRGVIGFNLSKRVHFLDTPDLKLIHSLILNASNDGSIFRSLGDKNSANFISYIFVNLDTETIYFESKSGKYYISTIKNILKLYPNYYVI